MRRCAGLVLVLLASSARADDATSVGASIGAGAQGAATYGALELRLDQHWRTVTLGLGVRGVWADGVFRRSDWASVADAVTIVRELEAVTELDDGGHLALAAGRLAPAHVARIADGYRSTIDDRWRTGVRTAAVTATTEASLELDDVLHPVLIAGAVRYQLAPPWGAHAAVVLDPAAPTGIAADGSMPTRVATAIEAGASRRFSDDHTRVDVGVSIVAEVGLGFSAVAFTDATIARGDLRYSLRADARAGTGTVGAMFGPLYRIERLAHAGQAPLWERARAGELGGGSLGTTVGIAAPAGWCEVGVRTRPGLGLVATASAGAPMSRRVQAAVWAAVSPHDAAGAAELRIAWAQRLFSALDAARIYDLTTTMPTAEWTVTAWFGAATN